MRKLLLFIGLFILSPALTNATVSLIRDAATIKRGTLDNSRLDPSSVTLQGNNVILISSFSVVENRLDGHDLFISTSQSWNNNFSVSTKSYSLFFPTASAKIDSWKIAETTIAHKLDISTETVYIDVSGFDRVSTLDYSINLIVSTGGLFEFNPVTPNWMAKWVNFPTTHQSYDIFLSSFIVASTGTLTDTMSFIISIATFGSTGNFVNPVYNQPITFNITDNITESEGVAVAQNVTLTGWKDELLGRSMPCLIKVFETTDDNTVPNYFIGMTFKIIGYK